MMHNPQGRFSARQLAFEDLWKPLLYQSMNQ